MIVHAEQMRGYIRAIPSKSVLQRRLIINRLAGFCDAPDYTCSDVQTTVGCLAQLGTDAPLDVGECGSALRFLLPVSTLFGGGIFTGNRSLKCRPIEPLLSVLCAHGATVTDRTLPLTIRGTLKAGDYRLDGGISSQFFSGLMMTLPFLTGDSTLTWTSPIGSYGYTELTASVLSEHGVRIERIENGFRIPGGQKANRQPLHAEGDWSCAAPMLILGAVCGSVTATGLSCSSLQPDRKILEVLIQCGANVDCFGDGVTVSRSRLCGFKCSGNDAPDLVPVLAALACACEGDSVLYRLERLRYKESDRFEAICRMLDSLGADFETERSDTIVIHGSGSIRGGFADVPADHRMVMAAALASACSAAPVTIPHAECVRKSYPSFFDDYRFLGGQTDAI